MEDSVDDLRPCGNDFNGAFVDDAAVLRSHMLALHLFCAPLVTLLIMLTYLVRETKTKTKTNPSGAAGPSAISSEIHDLKKRRHSSIRYRRLLICTALWFVMVAIGFGVVYAAERWRMFTMGGVIDESIVIMHVLWMFHVPFVSTLARICAGIVVIGIFIAKVIFRRQATQMLGDTIFLIAYCVLASIPMVLNEHYASYNFVRNKNHAIEQHKIGEVAKRSHLLLCRILPPQVVEQMHAGRKIIADHFRSVTIVFTDLKGFTKYSSSMSPSALLEWLNNIYSAFDEILENYDLYKVEIIGDAYYVVGGCPGVLTNRRHASDVIDAGLAMQRVLVRIVQDDEVSMRVGIHSGPVTAAVVGKQDPRYHLFGSTVTYAEKMEETGVPGKVHISSTTYEYVRDVDRYEFEARGAMQIDGDIGEDIGGTTQFTYFVDGKPDPHRRKRSNTLSKVREGY
jgi:class 3 adenylate cyclase